MGHLLLHSLGWFIAVAWPQEPYGGIVDGLRCLRGELLARKSRALASAVTSAATDLLFLVALCTLRVRAVRSAVQRSPSPLLDWRALASPAPTVPARWAVHGEARGGALPAPHCGSRSVGGAWGGEAPSRAGSLRATDECCS